MANFKDMESFIAGFSRVSDRVARAQRVALGRVAESMEKDAKSQLGTYQGAVGPLEEWRTLAAFTQEDRKRKGFHPNQPLLRKGDLRDSIGHRVRADGALIGSTSMIARWQEFGTRENGEERIPPRPFLGRAAFGGSHEAARVIGNAVARAIGGERET